MGSGTRVPDPIGLLSSYHAGVCHAVGWMGLAPL